MAPIPSPYILFQTLTLVLWNLLAPCEGRYYYPLPGGRQQYARQEQDSFTMDIRMPGIIPKRPEEYLCYAATSPIRDSYIVKFEPRASMKTIHHMLVYGCRNLDGDEETVTTCHGSPCKGQSNIMFGWARDADSPTIPRGVGFHVGGSSGINYIMIQLHYGDNLDHLQGTSGDHSGISLTLTHTPQPSIGGIYLLWSGSINIPPHSQNVHSDIACKYDSVANIHPFAFRTHAHEMGKVITGYLIRNGEWTVIAKGNPQWPQAFYPILDDFTIQPGDILAARCTYDSEREKEVHAGGTHLDEMCNLYLMYYTDATRGEAFQECGRTAPSTLFQSAPPGSNQAPAHMPSVAPQQPTQQQQQPPRNRYRPPIANANPFDQYYDTYRDGYYNTGASFLPEGGSEDYISPGGVEGEGATGGEDQGDTPVTSRPDETVDTHPAAPLVTSSQNADAPDVQGVTDIPPKAAEKGTTVTSPPAASDKALPIFTVTDVDGWPSGSSGVTLGQVSGVAVDSQGNVHIFHRASRPWGLQSFIGNTFSHPEQGPINNNTVIKYDSNTGSVISQWGANQFYLPHGLSIDHEDNVWLTDVAMHQVFKYPPGGAGTPLLILGKKLVQGGDREHFCKPSDVAVDPNTGNFFVSDGYCNNRVVKFSPEGQFLLEWGHEIKGHPLNPPISQFNLPHCITMVPDKAQVCVADREVGRIQCFESETGNFVKQFNLPQFGGRLYAVTYSSASGGLLYAVNGPSNKKQPVRGFAINFTSSEILQTWKPQNEEFQKPHDVVCTPDGKLVYVAEIGPNKVWKFSTNAELFVDLRVTESEAQTVPAPVISATQSPDTPTLNVTVNVTDNTPSVNTTGTSTSYQPLLGSQTDGSVVDERINGLSSDANLGTTTIIVAVLAVPILLMLLVAIAIRMHTQGRFRLNRTGKYKVSAGDKFSLGSLLHKRNGFSKVSTEEDDRDEREWSEESDIEEYSILNNSKRTQNL